LGSGEFCREFFALAIALARLLRCPDAVAWGNFALCDFLCFLFLTGRVAAIFSGRGVPGAFPGRVGRGVECSCTRR
jgi:hypothetical protein